MITVAYKPALRAKLVHAEAEKRHEHARRCKKALDECLVCQGNIAWFNELTPQLLSSVLEEKKTV